MIRYVLFDLDGTLTDPGLGITNCVKYALEKFDISVSSREELYPYIGPPLTWSFQEYHDLSEEQAQRALLYYRERFSSVGMFALNGIASSGRYENRERAYHVTVASLGNLENNFIGLYCFLNTARNHVINEIAEDIEQISGKTSVDEVYQIYTKYMKEWERYVFIRK